MNFYEAYRHLLVCDHMDLIKLPREKFDLYVEATVAFPKHTCVEELVVLVHTTYLDDGLVVAL